MGGVFKPERLIELLEQAQDRLSECSADWDMADAIEEAICRLRRPKEFLQWPIPTASSGGTVNER